MKTVRVSRSSAYHLRLGHPWLRVDKHTKGLEHCHDGEAVTLVDERGQGLGSALVDRQHHSIAARLFHRRGGKAFDAAAAIHRAWDRRQALHDDPGTDCYRLVHGEADFLPGLRIERFGDCLVILEQAACILPHLDAIIDALLAHLPGACIVVREHLDDLRRREVHSCRVDGQPCRPDDVVACRELDVAWQATPFDGLACGIYVDQRATRSWLRQRCRGAQVLNCFAYTGLFSLSLLAAGAAGAVDLDLSAPALEHAAAMARLNGLSDRHRIERGDCLQFAKQDSGLYDLIICDPPTAALGGGGWVARRDYPKLLNALLPRLSDQGLLVCANNTLGKPYDLERALREAAREARIHYDLVPPPAIGDDIPQLKGFPEGLPYRLVVMQRRH